MRSKITELGVFSIGISIIGGFLSVYRSYFIETLPLELALGLGECAVALVLGLLVCWIRSATLIQILVTYFLIATCVKISLSLPQLSQSFLAASIGIAVWVVCAGLIYSVGMRAIAETEDSTPMVHRGNQPAGEMGPPICPHCDSLLTFAERTNAACPRCQKMFASSIT